MTKFLKVLIICLTLLPLAAFSQKETKEQLALQYYLAGEYDKASVLYEELFEKKPNAYYYTYYLNCLVELQEFKKAEKFIKRLQKQKPFRKNFTVELGYVYLKSGDIKKAEKEFNRAIDKLPANKSAIINLSNAFLSRRLFDWSEKTYLQGRKLLKGDYGFHLELATSYQSSRNYTKMTFELLELLKVDELYLETVQNRLQNIMAYDTQSGIRDILREQLIQRVQDEPDQYVYNEMLLWFSMQEKEFDMALIQAKALDKRFDEDGMRVFHLGQIAASNKAWDVSIEAYNYVLGFGKSHHLYLSAEIHLLEVKYNKLESSGDFSQEDLLILEQDYLELFDELGKNASTIVLLKNLAHLQGFYLDKTDEAIKNLEYAIKIETAKPRMIAECKIELADILLMSGDIWEATLLYSQVEKAFKYDPVGHEAKFKNAKLSFYIGEFDWAKAQLDVLRAATSKLIANDAMELSLLIADNLAIDSNYAALELYAEADLLLFMKQPDLALVKLDSLDFLFPTHRLADELLYKKALIHIEKKNYELADSLLNDLLILYSYDILADNALMTLAEMHDYKLNNKEKAKGYYEQIILDHPDSLFTVEARKRYRELRGDLSDEDKFFYNIQNP